MEANWIEKSSPVSVPVDAKTIDFLLFCRLFNVHLLSRVGPNHNGHTYWGRENYKLLSGRGGVGRFFYFPLVCGRKGNWQIFIVQLMFRFLLDLSLHLITDAHTLQIMSQGVNEGHSDSLLCSSGQGAWHSINSELIFLLLIPQGSGW